VPPDRNLGLHRHWPTFVGAKRLFAPEPLFFN
jgi:hypothetical protein